MISYRKLSVLLFCLTSKVRVRKIGLFIFHSKFYYVILLECGINFSYSSVIFTLFTQPLFSFSYELGRNKPYRLNKKVLCVISVAYPGIFFGGGVQQIQLRTEERENGDLGGGSPLVRGSGGSCNLVQEISFHMVKFS